MTLAAPIYADDHVTLWQGAALTVLRGLPAQSVDCCVTSPPYFALRSYLPEGHPDKAAEIGTEKSPAEFVESLRAVFAEVRRVLTDDGTLWINLGDTYYSGKGASVGPDKKQSARRGFVRSVDTPGASWAPAPKNLLGIPWRVAFALQDDGWILRNDIIWAKPNGMPSSVEDRLSNRHEHVFMFSKSRRYWFDLDAVREPAVTPPGAAKLSWNRATKEADVPGQSMRQHRSRPDPAVRGAASGVGVMPNGARHTASHPAGKNPGDVWTIPTVPFTGAHYAVMAPEVARRAIRAGCKPGGVVLDPFSGSGTTGMVALETLRRYVGIDLDEEALRLSLQTRLRQGALTFGESSVWDDVRLDHVLPFRDAKDPEDEKHVSWSFS